MKVLSLPDIRERGSLKGKRVLLRSGLNVPLKDGNVVDDYRLKQALLTICFLQKTGARTILIGHIGRDPSESLKPIFEYLKKYVTLCFVENVLGSDVKEAVTKMENGDVVMLENVRKEKGECNNDETFARELASYADVYVNDAFSVSHRRHASLVGLPLYLPAYVGIAFQNEVKGLTPALSPKSPSLCIIGGAKFETKVPLIRKFFKVYDIIFIGGALSNDFFKAKGYSVGTSLVSDTPPDLDGLLGNPKLRIPIDVIAGSFEKTAVKKVSEVSDNDYIFDAGPETAQLLEKLVNEAAFVLWNGPLGQYDDGFTKQTTTLAKSIINSNIDAVIGGGDTVAAISGLHPEHSRAFISTAGGAMLEFLLNGTLPGIEALKVGIKEHV